MVKVDQMLQSALDTTAAGDIWDNSFKAGVADGTYRWHPETATGSDASASSINYTLPTLVDGLSVSVPSYSAWWNSC